MNVRNLERVGEKKFKSYEAAAKHKASLVESKDHPIAKTKIFARYDGTYDVVWYRKIGDKLEGKKIEQVIVDDVVRPARKQKSKERKKK